VGMTGRRGHNGIIDEMINNRQDIEAKLTRLNNGEPLRVVDLFAGCGGMSLGFKRAGYELLGGIEHDANAARTYAINFFKDSPQEIRDRHSIPHDMTKLTPELFMQEVLGEKNPLNLVDVIIGGPPCQAFARVGRAKLREIMNHPEAYREDKRASLYVHYLEYVAFFQPLAVIIENVPDIMNFGGQNVAEEIATSLEEWGYRCRYTILNAAHYGVPQWRHRFYLIALLDGLGLDPSFPTPTHFIKLPAGYGNLHSVAVATTKGHLPQAASGRYIEPPAPIGALPRPVTAKDALADLPAISTPLHKTGVRKFNTLLKYRPGKLSEFARSMRTWPGFESKDGIYDHIVRSLPRDVPIFARMRPDDQYPEAYELALQIFDEELASYEKKTGTRPVEGSEEYNRLRARRVPPYDPNPQKFPNKWWKLVPDKPVRTLTAHIGKDTYSHIHYDGEQARVISVREAARLQSFPDGFQFLGPMNPAFKQIGNAVPPLQAYRLAVHIQHLLLKASASISALSSIGDQHSRSVPDALYRRAMNLHEQGWKQQEIAAAVGVSQGTISQWLKQRLAGNAVTSSPDASPGIPQHTLVNHMSSLEKIPG
jgi:DNA (cytosine-5)-methyltransferase 1